MGKRIDKPENRRNIDENKKMFLKEIDKKVVEIEEIIIKQLKRGGIKIK